MTKDCFPEILVDSLLSRNFQLTHSAIPCILLGNKKHFFNTIKNDPKVSDHNKRLPICRHHSDKFIHETGLVQIRWNICKI